MNGRDALLEARVIWLTKAIRGLLKTEFGEEKYASMEVGKLDALLQEREKEYDQASKDFADFLKDPSDSSAMEKLKKLLDKEK